MLASQSSSQRIRRLDRRRRKRMLALSRHGFRSTLQLGAPRPVPATFETARAFFENRLDQYDRIARKLAAEREHCDIVGARSSPPRSAPLRRVGHAPTHQRAATHARQIARVPDTLYPLGRSWVRVVR